MKCVLKDKNIVLTGGSRGIGKIVASHLGQNGATINIISRTESDLKKTESALLKKGYNVKVFRADVLNASKIQSIISQLEPVDVLINCAGVQGEIGPFHLLDQKKWKLTFDINFHGTLNCIFAVLPRMIRLNKGKIINFAGGGASYSRPFFSAYGVSKASIVRFTEILADELCSNNIQINAISPGTIRTRMIDQIIQAGPKIAGKEYDQIQKKMKVGFDSPETAAELVCYLASDESCWISGKIISAVWDPWKDWKDKGKTNISRDSYTLRRVDEKHFGEIKKI